MFLSGNLMCTILPAFWICLYISIWAGPFGGSEGAVVY